jgi:hypothetical protein
MTRFSAEMLDAEDALHLALWTHGIARHDPDWRADTRSEVRRCVRALRKAREKRWRAMMRERIAA